MDTVEILKEFSEYLHVRDISNWLFRSVGIGIIRLLYLLVGGINNLLEQLFELIEFVEYDGVNELIRYVLPASISLLTISLAFVGFQVMMGKDVNIKSVFRNLLFAALVVIVLPVGMSYLKDLTTIAVKHLGGGTDSVAVTIVKANITDVLLLDQQDFQTENIEPRNLITEENFAYTDLLAYIDADSDDVQNKEVFQKKLVTDVTGNATEVDLVQSWTFDWFKEYYYRYDINFFTIILQLVTVAFVYIFTGLKMVKVTYEIAVNQILASVIAFSDIGTGQRLKKVLENILSSFAVIAIIFLLIKVYSVYMTWIATVDMNDFAKTVAVLAVGIAVIDGPNIVERIFGMDAGLEDGYKKAKGAAATTKMLGRGVKGLYKGAKGLHSLLDSDNKNDSKSIYNEKEKDSNGQSNGNKSSQTLGSLSNSEGSKGSDTSNMPVKSLFSQVQTEGKENNINNAESDQTARKENNVDNAESNNRQVSREDGSHSSSMENKPKNHQEENASSIMESDSNSYPIENASSLIDNEPRDQEEENRVSLLDSEPKDYSEQNLSNESVEPMDKENKMKPSLLNDKVENSFGKMEESSTLGEKGNSITQEGIQKPSSLLENGKNDTSNNSSMQSEQRSFSMDGKGLSEEVPVSQGSEISLGDSSMSTISASESPSDSGMESIADDSKKIETDNEIRYSNPTNPSLQRMSEKYNMPIGGTTVSRGDLKDVNSSNHRIASSSPPMHRSVAQDVRQKYARQDSMTRSTPRNAANKVRERYKREKLRDTQRVEGRD